MAPQLLQTGQTELGLHAWPLGKDCGQVDGGLPSSAGGMHEGARAWPSMLAGLHRTETFNVRHVQ